MKRCYVLGELCPSADSHHVVPGVGPLVNLRPDIHQTVHRCIKNPTLKDEFLAGLKAAPRLRAEYLIDAIIQSETAGIVRKTKKITVEIPTDAYRRLKRKAEDHQLTVNKLLVQMINSFNHEA